MGFYRSESILKSRVALEILARPGICT